ncbi:MAG TPA: glycosyltransferase family 2 protein [Syntrophorhabdaceae bacterium]|jgi:GT2 family glycosyltransferase
MEDLISVVILNWNGNVFIRGCLDTVLSQDYPNLEVIVVDNGSSDGSQQIIRDEYKRVVLIEIARNLGFGGGNNIGIDRARGKYVLILNNDTEIDMSCVSEMKRALDRNKGYGACASRIDVMDPPDTIDAAGIAVYPDGLAMGRGKWEPAANYAREEEVFFASGCCALFKREMLEDIAIDGEYYDNDFFAYADDTDLGWRAQLRGWRCVYAPAAKCRHLHSATSGYYSAFKAYLVERNRMWLMVKDFPLPLIIYGQMFTFLRYAHQAVGAITGKGAAGKFSEEHSKARLVTVLLKVYRDFLLGLPKMLKKRRAILGRRTVSVGKLFRIMKTYHMTTKDITSKA